MSAGSGTTSPTGRFADEVLALAKGLIAAGIEAGDRVAVMSKTRYEWTLADFAVLTVGAVVVPIYETSSAEQVEWILSNSGAKGAFIETDEHQRNRRRDPRQASRPRPCVGSSTRARSTSSSRAARTSPTKR